MHACTLRARAIVQPPDIGIQLNQLIPSILCENRLCQLKKEEFQSQGAVLEPVHAMKVLDLTLILSYWDLLYLFPLGSYCRLNKKCRYKTKSS